MKKIFYLSSFLLFSLCACNSNDKETPKAEDGLDAVRNFIQAALYSDYPKARAYMLPDSINLEQMNAIERVKLSTDEKQGLATSSINIHESIPVNDSTTIVIYSNSYKNNRDTLKALRIKGKWLVDFKYLFNHSSDSIWNKKDSLDK